MFNKINFNISISVVLASSFFLIDEVIAGNGTTEIADSQTITSATPNLANGLLESNATAAVNVTLDSSAGAITLGANGTDSLSITSNDANADVTLNITTSGAPNGVIFADDLDAEGNAGNSLTINITNEGSVTFRGNIQSTVGTTAADINIGSGSADPNLFMTVDTANNENLSIEATIDAVDTGDTANIIVQNSDGTLGNTVTFQSALGSSVGLSTITLNANTEVTFNGTVTVTNNTGNFGLGTTRTTTFNDDVTVSGQLRFTADGTVSMAADKRIAGNLDATSANLGTVTFAATTTNTTLVSGTTGATNAIKVVNVAPNTGVTSTFSGAYDAITTTHSGAGTVAFGSTVGANASSNINISSGGAVNIAGSVGGGGVSNVDNTSGSDGSGTLVLTGTATNFTGNIGATNSLASVTIDSTGGTSTITGSVNATTITLSGTGTTAFTNNDVTGTVNFTADGTATVTADEKIVGSVTTGTTNTGTLTFATSATNTTVVNSSVGASGALLKQVTAGAASGITATFGGDVFATTVTVANSNASGTVAFSGNVNATTLNFSSDGIATLADNKNITASVTTGTGNTGTLTFLGTSTLTGNIATNANVLKAINVNGSGDTVTLTGDLHATTTTIANLATLKFTKAATTVTGSISASGTSGTIDVGTATVTASGTVTLGANSKLAVTIGDSNGQLDASTSGVTLSSGTTIVPTVSGSLTSGTAIVILKDDDGNLGTAVENLVVTDNSSQFNFSLALNGNNLELTPTAVSTNMSSNASAVNDVVDVAFANDTTLSSALNGLAGSSAQNTALESLAPVVDGGSVVGTVLAGRAPLNTVSLRLASLRTGISAGQGLSAGEEVDEQKNFWLQGFGTYVDQSERQGIQGFEASTGGFAFGTDKQINNTLLLGLAGSYSYTDVDSRLSENLTYINSYQGTVYGTYNFGDSYLNAQFGFAYNDYDAKRFISVGAVDRQANADYEGYQFLTKFELGRDISLANEIEFNPSLGLSWTHVKINDYTETGAGASNLMVNNQDYDILNFSLLGELRHTVDLGQGSLTPEIHLGYNFEAIDDQIQTVAAFTGGGNTFQSTGFDPANHSAIGGAGLSYSGYNFDLVATYDFEVKQDFVSHSTLLKGRWNF